MNIVVVGTSYTLFLYLLYSKTWRNDTFVFGECVDEIFLQRLGAKTLFYQKPIRSMSEKIKFLKYLFRMVLFVRVHRSLCVYGNDHIPQAIPFLENGFIVLEEGWANYEHGFAERWQKEHAHCKWPLSIFKKYIPLGYDNAVKQIVLTGMQSVPDRLKEKVFLVNLETLWNKKTSEERREILRVFGMEDDVEGTHERILYLSQPFLHPGTSVLEEDVLRHFRGVVEAYGEKNVVVKPHPFDKFAYKKYFHDIRQIPRECPVEVLLLRKDSYKKILTWPTCSANMRLPRDIPVEYYDVDFREKLPSTYFSLEYLRQ